MEPSISGIHLLTGIVLFLLVIGIFGFIWYKLGFVKGQKKMLVTKVSDRTIELSELNTLLEEKQEEISLQNEELAQHRENLEIIVEERTEAMKRAMQRAEEADKLKSAFLANMSHEIRTPMNAIVGFSALLNNEDIGDKERAEFTEIILNNCNTLMVLINDILEVSMIEAHQIELKSEPFNADRILEELEVSLKLNNKKNLAITFMRKKGRKALILRNDATRFRQIFNNLLNNAYKYTERGSIEFGYTIAKGRAEFYVRDTGIGIAEEEYQNIFNFFHKIDKGGNQFYRGAGIGLSISNKLTELMGGKIWLQSKLGAGTTFYVSFDSEEIEEEPAAKAVLREERSTKVPDLRMKTFVVAEDESANYMLIQQILKKTKARLLWARNGKEAIDIVNSLQNTKDCLVIMDIKMPIMNGIRAAEEIGKIDATIPVIAVTAYAQTQNREKILQHNFVDYIAKPLNPKLLLKSITRHMN